MDDRDYSRIGIKCFICKTLGHIAVECPRYDEIRGNDKQEVKDAYKKRTSFVDRLIGLEKRLENQNNSIKVSDEDDEEIKSDEEAKKLEFEYS